MHALMLWRTVGGKEGAADIDDGLALPFHDEARLGSDARHGRSFQVFLVGDFQEFLNIIGSKRYRHTLLALRDRQLGPIETLVLLGHVVKIDMKAVRKLADGD